MKRVDKTKLSKPYRRILSRISRQPFGDFPDGEFVPIVTTKCMGVGGEHVHDTRHLTLMKMQKDGLLDRAMDSRVLYYDNGTQIIIGTPKEVWTATDKAKEIWKNERKFSDMWYKGKEK